MAPSLLVLVVGRIVTGVGAAAVPVLSIIAVTRLLPADRRGVGIGVVSAGAGAGAGIGTAAGPAVGVGIGEALGTAGQDLSDARIGAGVLLPRPERAGPTSRRSRPSTSRS